MNLLQALRFGRYLDGFLRKRLSFEEAMRIIRARFERREESFLTQLDRCVYSRPDSPYQPLLSAAGCTRDDVRDMVRRDGLEKTLTALKDAGVYLTFEEFKGRRPVQRPGVEYTVRSSDFDNPFVHHYYTSSTGGSTGNGVTVRLDLDHIEAMVPYNSVFHHFAGTAHVPHVLFFPIFPGFIGPTVLLKQHMAGMPVTVLFSPQSNMRSLGCVRQWLVRNVFLGMLRRHGAEIPDPKPVGMDHAGQIARTLHAVLQEHGGCFFGGYLSTCVRICQAALEQGLDLSGLVFSAGGEPATPAKLAVIEKTGSVNIPNYFMTETDGVGSGCLTSDEPNDNHLFEDSLAMIQGTRKVFGREVGAFYFTSLLPSAPKIMLNVESDDYGVVEKRKCGCPYEELGLSTHVSSIFSFGKLTGNAATLVNSDAVYILEKRLPELFGGGPLDYQLREVEDDAGNTRIQLIVSPEVPERSETSFIQAFLGALTEETMANPFASDQWRAFESLQVLREKPVATSRGKVLPLHVAGRF